MLFILAVPSTITAQEISKACNLNYKIGVAPDNKISSNDIIAIMDWDFTEAIKSAKSIKVEVVPINDSYNKEKAIDFKQSVFYDINKKNAKFTSEISHINMMAKSFRFRVVLITSNCEKTSDWTYCNFVQ